MDPGIGKPLWLGGGNPARLGPVIPGIPEDTPMLRTFSFLLACALTAAPAAAQTAPAQFDQLLTIKTQAAESVDAVLSPLQKQRIHSIALDTERTLRDSFGQPATSVQGIFTPAQLEAIAAALRSGTMPVANENQMGQIAQLMSGVVLKAAPAWQAHAQQVDALLTPAQRDRIGLLRAGTLQRLPHIAFMGMDLFGGLGDGSQIGGFLTDPGSFALLLALPDTDELLNVAKRQTRP